MAKSEWIKGIIVGVVILQALHVGCTSAEDQQRGSSSHLTYHKVSTPNLGESSLDTSREITNEDRGTQSKNTSQYPRKVSSKKVDSNATLGLNSSSKTVIASHLVEPAITATSHYIIDDLPVGYVKNGTVDYTLYVQRALNRYDNVVFPPFPILINDTGLKISSNTTITFLKGSLLKLKPSQETGYAILDIKNANNITLVNPVIQGDRFNHLGKGGEWGMGISIKGSSNINVIGARITDCWGDGIYIGQVGKGDVPKNIFIKDAYLSKNRRDGISIISVNGLVLENVYSAHHDGTKPMCGINFETNNPGCEIKNVKVINPKTEYNGGSGIQIGISTLLGGNPKKVDVKIINHVDVGSKSFAVKVACNRKNGIYGGEVLGKISIINPTWNSTIGDRPLAFITDQNEFKVEVTSARVKQSNGNVLNDGEIKAVLKKHSNGQLSIDQL
ncbi:right-handed parallel beta-helix repeat-containing protein [Flavihumibacter sp. R14]|nr:right-handed parallel beta-helix repeat-containing protein [Flavihumibacter soli]